jgi:predicted NodU family carbamoyl transferase
MHEEPIVCTADDAVRAFLDGNLDYLLLGVLGLSAFFHDSAACLLEDGEIVAAASEIASPASRADASFPTRPWPTASSEAGISLEGWNAWGSTTSRS